MRKLIKNILRTIPFKKQLYTVIKNIFHPNERIFKHLHFKGVFKISISKGKTFKMMHYGYQIENELFWSGIENGWEKETLGIWLKLSAISPTILDIGANTGCFALMSKTVNENAYIAAFEPVKRVFEKLEFNVKLNNYDIKCLELALSNYTGTATIFDQPTEHVYSVSVNKDISNTNLQTIPTEIKTLTLKDFISENSLTKIDLMKIDVETHEAEVLQGMGEYLAKFKPTMLIEILNDEVGKNIQALIDDLGYLYFNIDEDHGLTRTTTLTKSKSYNYLICLPEIAVFLDLDQL